MSARELIMLPIRKAQGFALIDLIFVCGIIGVLCSIALPRLLLAKQIGRRRRRRSASMRVINSAQLTYALTCGYGFYAPNLTTLGTPPPGSREPFIARSLGSADTVTKSGYIIQMSAAPYPGAPGSCNGLGVGAGRAGLHRGRRSGRARQPALLRHQRQQHHLRGHGVAVRRRCRRPARRRSAR